jgi:hypothetical protein
MAAKFEISKDHAGKFRFHLKALIGDNAKAWKTPLHTSGRRFDTVRAHQCLCRSAPCCDAIARSSHSSSRSRSRATDIRRCDVIDLGISNSMASSTD